MFTGLIETAGAIEKLTHKAQSVELAIAVRSAEFTTGIGASVAVNGVCLTVETVMAAGGFTATAVAETLRRSTLGSARVGDTVNLERSLAAQGRFEGHIVLGHVDGVGKIIADKRAGESIERSFEIPEGIRKFVAEKGSVAIDGISLTVASKAGAAITVALVPHTLAHTTMAHKRPGDIVNIEIDILARYIETLLRSGAAKGPADKSFTAALENFLA
ncbi:MAG: riboflavin synthase [Chitinivibrionales bacterium]|nr:riboflavin synthase [Chitinivibrionales bacterium]